MAPITCLRQWALLFLMKFPKIEAVLGISISILNIVRSLGKYQISTEIEVDLWLILRNKYAPQASLIKQLRIPH